MIETHRIEITPGHVRAAIGYACTSAWAVVLLFSPLLNDPHALPAAPLSMLPGLVACFCSVLLFRRFPSIEGRTWFVTAAALFMALGTLLCTYPTLAQAATAHIAGLALSGFFAIILIMSWFDAFARFSPRAIVALAGCALSLSAIMCWCILACPNEMGSIFVSLLPMLSFVLLPNASNAGENSAARESRTVKHNTGALLGANANDAASPVGPPRTEAAQANQSNDTARLVEPSVLRIVAGAVPVRTLVGLSITFFIISSLGSLAPETDLFTQDVAPLSLAVPLALTAFFVAGAFLVRKSIDTAFLYKILLLAFAAGVFLLAFSIGISAALVFYAVITADVMIWMVLALLAKKTPVAPHLVFAIGWTAECVGNSLGQSLAPLFTDNMQVFFAVAIMLILVAVGFAFSEGSLVLDVDFSEDDLANASTVQEACETATENQGGASPAGNFANAGDASAPDASAIDQLRQTKSAATKEDRVISFAAAHGISPRERDVLTLWLAGRGLKHIENTLFISESTVKSHLRSIYRKCETHNRDEIIELFESETSAQTQ